MHTPNHHGPEPVTGDPVDALSVMPSSVAVDLERVVRGLVREPDRWAGHIDFNPVERCCVRLPLRPTEADLELWLLTWMPGQGTWWHDHGGVCGSFAVIKGELCEQVSTRPTEVDLDAPGSHPDHETVVRAGGQLTFAASHLHRVVNHTSTSAVSLHANPLRRPSRGGGGTRDDRAELLTAHEVADLFRVSTKTVLRWTRDGRLPTIRTFGGHHRYSSRDVNRALRQMGGSDV